MDIFALHVLALILCGLLSFRDPRAVLPVLLVIALFGAVATAGFACGLMWRRVPLPCRIRRRPPREPRR